MVSKQLLWRDSSTQQIFFSLLLITLSFSFSAQAMEQTYRSLKSQSTNAETTISEPKKRSNYFYGRSREELEVVFKYAPWKAKEIVDHLKDPEALAEPEYRAVFFVGQPGTGKTTTAIAIAKKARWGCKFIRCSELQRSYRNRSSEVLLSQLEEAKKCIKKGEKTVVIADELGLILKKPNDNHRDNDAASGTLQGFLDDMEGEDDFFFIGTMNDDTDMSESIKNRMELDRIIFSPISDPIIKRDIFCKKLITPRMQLSSECTDKVIDDIIIKLSNCPFRSYKNMRKELSRILYHEQSHRKIRFIKQKHLELVTEALLQARKDLKVGIEEETDAQRQDRHFLLNAKLQTLLHQDTLKQQDQHFVQQQAINVVTLNGKEETVSKSFLGLLGSSQEGGLKQRAHDIITERIFSPSQQAYYWNCLRENKASEKIASIESMAFNLGYKFNLDEEVEKLLNTK